MHSRRKFLQLSSLSMGMFSFSIPFTKSEKVSQEAITIGLVADAHKDIMHDADDRLSAFTRKTMEKRVDAIIQMGDFCFPKAKNLDFLNILREFSGPIHHVLGNHDMDTSTKEATMDFWGMPAKYYSFDLKGFHFIVLDANYLYTEGQFIDYSQANFYVDSSLRTHIHPDQIDWLRADLENTSLPTFIFSHQSLAHEMWGVKNRLAVQRVIEEANEKANSKKVLACFNGHNHIDFHRTINGVHYIDINSLSYSWLGEKYSCFTRYDAKVYDSHPSMAYIAPYEDPLFAFLHIDKEIARIEGVRTNWYGPTPSELGVPEGLLGSKRNPTISNWELDL